MGTAEQIPDATTVLQRLADQLYTAIPEKIRLFYNVGACRAMEPLAKEWEAAVLEDNPARAFVLLGTMMTALLAMLDKIREAGKLAAMRN